MTSWKRDYMKTTGWGDCKETEHDELYLGPNSCLNVSIDSQSETQMFPKHLLHVSVK